MNARILIPTVLLAASVLGVARWIAGMPHAPAQQAASTAPLPPGSYVGADDNDVQGAAGTSAAAATTRAESRVGLQASWLTQTAHQTAIPARALQGYAEAALAEGQTDPGCHLAWNTLAGIGDIESGHGTHGGAHIDPATGNVTGTILGPALDGAGGTQAIPNTDPALDGPGPWARAVGPLQFLPSTWQDYGISAAAGKTPNPDNIDDAALTAAHYLCAAGGDLSTAAGWTKAIEAFNHDPSYAGKVRDAANQYAREAQ